jgi:hypothetical protein
MTTRAASHPIAPLRGPYSRTEPCKHQATPIRSRLAAVRYGPAAIATRIPAWVRRLSKSPCDPARGDCPDVR